MGWFNHQLETLPFPLKVVGTGRIIPGLVSVVSATPKAIKAMVHQYLPHCLVHKYLAHQHLFHQLWVTCQKIMFQQE